MKNYILLLILFFSATSFANENKLNQKFCHSVGGITEVRHNYLNTYIKVDCETEKMVYECGLDKRSSLDSVQQALFASVLTNKKPAVVIYDTDGKEGKYEFRIRKACEKANIKYLSIKITK